MVDDVDVVRGSQVLMLLLGVAMACPQVAVSGIRKTSET